MIDRDAAVAALRSALHSKCELERVIQGLETGEYDVEAPEGEVEDVQHDEPSPPPPVRRRRS